MSARRVVVTGMGMLSPLGNSVSESWEKAIQGHSGIDLISRFDTSDHSVKIGGEVKNLDATEYLDRKDMRRLDPFMQYGLVAAIQAAEAADVSSLSDAQKLRTGVAIGSGIGGIETIEQTRDALVKSGPRKVSPFFVPGSIINMISGNLAIRYGLKGPNIALVSACTTGTHNIGIAARSIAYGDADIMIAGGAEMATTPVAMAAFASAKALSTRNDDPQAASRPWDQDRDGFVLADGAGAIVLEEYQHAVDRGANIIAELIGFGMSDDAYHITSPSEDGAGASLSMNRALDDAGIDPSEVGYINAHGTSTPLGDVTESRAVENVFGEAASKLLVSSTKSMTGHCLGAAGAIEAIFTIKAIEEGIIPPTINLDNVSEDCNLDYVANEARRQQVNVALSNSFGFGGTNGSLIFRRVSN